MDLFKTSGVLLLIGITLVFCNCSKNDKNENTEIYVDPSSLHKNLKLSEVFSFIKYLQLETNKTCLLGLVQKMRVSNSRYYFLTGFSNERIVVFGKKYGNHLLTIDKNGRGPGEYVRAMDLYVDPDDKYFEVFSNGLQKLLRYNNEGKYLQEENIGTHLNSFSRLNQDLVMYSYKGINNQLIIKKDGKSTVLVEMDNYSIGDMNNFPNYGNNVSFGRSIDNNIYQINNNKAQIEYTLNFGKYQIPESFLQENYDKSTGFNVPKLYRSDYAYNIWSFYESTDFLILTIIHKNTVHLMVYSKETGQIRIADDFINDINNLTKVFKINREMIPVALDKDELIFTIEPVIIKEWIDQTKQSYSTQEWEVYKKENESIIKLYNNLKENDNPVIAKLKLIKF